MWKNIAVEMRGKIVALEPLESRHEEGLFRASTDTRIWRWMPRDPSVTCREGFDEWFEGAVEASGTRNEAAFAIRGVSTGELLGSTRYLALRPERRTFEIGWTWMSRAAWGSGANKEAKKLLLVHAFEDLGCLRVEFKTDSCNERSRAALEALPARFEGIFRKHMLVRDGERRDSAYYSIIDEEWPGVKASLERQLVHKGRGEKGTRPEVIGQ